MSETYTRALLVASLTLGLSIVLTFSQGGATPAYTQFGAGARPRGLGGAFTAIADDANSAFWNAANMALASGPELTATHAKSYLGSSFDYLAGVLPITVSDRPVSLGFYLVRSAVRDIPITQARVDTVLKIPSHYSGSFESICVALAASARFSELILLGVSADHMRERLLNTHAVGRAFHLSISADAKRQHTFLKRTTASVQMRNIGAVLSWSTGHLESSPPHIVLGIAHRPFLSDRLIVSGELEHAPWAPNPHSGWRTGLEFILAQSVPLRFGLDGQSVATGVGCKGGHIRVDYALSLHRDLGESHCVSLTLCR